MSLNDELGGQLMNADWIGCKQTIDLPLLLLFTEPCGNHSQCTGDNKTA